MNQQFLNEMFTLKKCTYDLERPAAGLTNYGLKSFKSYGAKIWNLLAAPYKIYFHYNIWGCMCSTGPFKYRWLKGYI